MKTEIIDQIRHPGLRIIVYSNRVEIKKRSFWFIFWNSTIIPMRNIASVEAIPATQVLSIMTNDGKKYRYRLGWRKAKRIRDAILDIIYK